MSYDWLLNEARLLPSSDRSGASLACLFSDERYLQRANGARNRTVCEDAKHFLAKSVVSRIWTKPAELARLIIRYSRFG